MDFSTVVVADAGDVVEGEVDSVTFTGDATNVVSVAPRVNPPIWDEVQFRTATHHPSHVTIVGSKIQMLKIKNKKRGGGQGKICVACIIYILLSFVFFKFKFYLLFNFSKIY